MLITSDSYFWFSDSLESFLLADLAKASIPDELALMLGDINYNADEDHDLVDGARLPPQCSDGACVITSNAVAKLREVSQRTNDQNQVLYFNDHMTYLALLVHVVNSNFEKEQLKIQYYSDSRFWSWHESDTDKLTCLYFNFPMRVYGKYEKLCEA